MNGTKKNRPVVMLTVTGMMAALVVVGSMARITVPAGLGTTSFHLGNIMCALSGILLGPWWGGLASAIGSTLYDLTNPLYVSECWITFLSKGAYGVVTGLIAWSGHKEGTGFGRNLAGTAAGAATYAALYLLKKYAWSGLLVAQLQPGPAVAAMLEKVPATAFNAVVALVCAPPLAAAIQKARGSLRPVK